MTAHIDPRLARRSRTSTKSYPVGTLELSGPEDAAVLAENATLLEPHAPVIVPGLRFDQLRRDAGLRIHSKALQSIFQGHEVILYESPEKYSYRMPERIIKTQWPGHNDARKEFTKHLAAVNPDGALELLPPFHRAFLRHQLYFYVKHSTQLGELASVFDRNEFKDGCKQAWLDADADKGGGQIVGLLAKSASRWPRGRIAAPVPLLRKTSSDQMWSMMNGMNKLATRAAKSYSEPGRLVKAYFHIYVDVGLAEAEENRDRLVSLVDDVIGSRHVAGVVLSCSGYDRAVRDDKISDLQAFVADLVGACESEDKRVVLPRSSGPGLWMADAGAQVLSGLLNGHTRLLRPGPGGPVGENAYGKVWIIDLMEWWKPSQVEDYLRRNGTLPRVPGIPSVPPTWNPSGSDSQSRWGKPEEYRQTFSKVRNWASLIEECRRFREHAAEGLQSPAKFYFTRQEAKQGPFAT